MHPCRRVQRALREAGIEYEKVIAAHGSPIPFLRKGSREQLRQETGTTKLPALKLSDGTVITPSRAILAWIAEQQPSPQQPSPQQTSPQQPSPQQPSPQQPSQQQPSQQRPSQQQPSQQQPSPQPPQSPAGPAG